MDCLLRKARITDVKAIHAALMEGSQLGLLLPRSLASLYKHCRDFYIVENEQNIFLGCCALSIVWDDFAEIRSLYVHTQYRGEGIGRILVEACAQEAVDMGISRLFTLTYQKDFFLRLGFKEERKDILPQKIWADCLHCPKFPDCDEIAMIKDLTDI